MWKDIEANNQNSYPKSMKYVPVAIYAGGTYLQKTAASYLSNDGKIKWLGVDGKNLLGEVVAWYDVSNYTRSA